MAEFRRNLHDHIFGQADTDNEDQEGTSPQNQEISTVNDTVGQMLSFNDLLENLEGTSEETNDFQNNVDTAIRTVDILRGFALPTIGQKKRKYNGGKKRGPVKSSLKIKLYHLPEQRKFPSLLLTKMG